MSLILFEVTELKKVTLPSNQYINLRCSLRFITDKQVIYVFYISKYLAY